MPDLVAVKLPVTLLPIVLLATVSDGLVVIVYVQPEQEAPLASNIEISKLIVSLTLLVLVASVKVSILLVVL